MSLLIVCVLIFGAGCFALGYVTAAVTWRGIKPAAPSRENMLVRNTEFVANSWWRNESGNVVVLPADEIERRMRALYDELESKEFP